MRNHFEQDYMGIRSTKISHHQGAVERMIGITKSILKRLQENIKDNEMTDANLR
jgi:hypothetical protein